jgi:hypothetical protein
MKNCTDEQLARAFLLGALRDGPATVEGIMRVGDQHGLDDGLLSEAAAGLAVTSFQYNGECCWQLPPNVLPFVPRRPFLLRLPDALWRAVLLLSLVIPRSFSTIFAPAGRTRSAVPTRARGPARAPGSRSITKQHPKDKWERYDTHSYNQD